MGSQPEKQKGTKLMSNPVTAPVIRPETEKDYRAVEEMTRRGLDR